MKIGLAVSRFEIGGVESYLLRLGSSLRRRGHEVVLIATDRCGAWWSRVPEAGLDTVAVLPSESRSVHAWVREVGRRIRALSLDVLLLNHALAAQASLNMLGTHTIAIPVVHSEDLPVIRTACANRDAWDLVIAPSPRLRRQAIEEGLDEDRVLLIPHGIEVPDVLSPRHPGDGPLELLYVGRIEDAHKGVFLLPEILATVRDRGIEATLTVIGEGSDASALERGMRERGLSGFVTFLGRQPNDVVIDRLRDAGVLVMPSYFEGMPILILEAMANGCLLVVSRLPEITDWALEDGRCGYLAEKGQADTFSHAIEEIVRRPDEAEARRRSAYERCRTVFSIDGMVDAYLDAIARVRRCGVRPNRSGPDVARGMLSLKDYLPNAFRRVLSAARKVLVPTHRDARKERS